MVEREFLTGFARNRMPPQHNRTNSERFVGFQMMPGAGSPGGLSATQLAKALGARVIATDISGGIRCGRADWAARCRAGRGKSFAATGGRRADMALEATRGRQRRLSDLGTRPLENGEQLVDDKRKVR